MKITVYVLISICFFSCSKNNKVEFFNNSSSKVDSVLIIANPNCEPLVIKYINPLESRFDFLENCDIKSSDGSYIIKVYQDNQVFEKGYGYFSNGYAIFQKLKIELNESKEILTKEID